MTGHSVSRISVSRLLPFELEVRRLRILLVFVLMSVLRLQAQECPPEIVRANRAASVFIQVDKTKRITGEVLHETGTGFVVSTSGYVLTANHVIKQDTDIDEVRITGAIGSAYSRATRLSLIGEDESKDIALLKFDNTNETYHAISIGDPADVEVGTPLCSIGFPLQTEFHLVGGRLGGKGGPKGYWQADMPSTQGESGAPVFTPSGQVVAIKWGGYKDAQNVNLLIPINLAQQVLLLVPDLNRNANTSGFAEIAVRSKSRQYDVPAYSPLKLSLDVVIRSEKKVVLDDVVVTLEFWVIDEDTRSRRKLDPDESAAAFSLSEEKLLLPLLDDQNSKTHLELVVGCQEVGSYEIVVHVNSAKKKLASEDTVGVNVRPFDIGFLNHLPKGAMPTFLLRKSILSVAPRFLGDMIEFRVVLLDEASRTNLSKATLWFSLDYLGSVGGLYFKVSTDSATNPDMESYYRRTITSTTAPSTLVEVGAVDGAADLIPVGASLYKVRHLDAQRLEFRRVDPDPCRLLVSIEPEYGLRYDQKPSITKLPGYAIGVTAVLDAGATGRNGLLTVTVDGKAYQEMVWAEPGNNVSSDFPIFLSVNKSGVTMRLRIQSKDERVTVEECPTQD